MRHLKQILIPTDFSENSRVALTAATALAARFRAKLHLVHAVPSLPGVAQRVLDQEAFAELRQEMQGNCEAEMRDLVKAHVDPGLDLELHVVSGDATEEIVDLAARLDVDLIALATKGHTGFKRFVLGSVAEKVIRAAPCPVLAVRGKPESWDRIGKILVPTDISEASEAALAEVVALAQDQGCEVVLAHAIEEVHPTRHVLRGRGLLDVNEQLRKGVEAHLQRMQTKLQKQSLTVSYEIVDGVPSAALADLAERQKVDLIAVTSHARTGLARFSLGSTAERLVRLAPCSVLVVRGPSQ